MPTVRGTPLEFLWKDAKIRRQEMKDELWDAIIRDETRYLAEERMSAEREGRPPLLENPFRDAVRRHIIAREKEWLDLDATEELSEAIELEQPFGLYLRPYAAEGFEEVALEVEGAFSTSRFVESSTVGRLHGRMQIYGLRNALDFHTLARYRPVWVPPKFRAYWQPIVHELAKYSKLIIIDATGSGTGSSCEMREIPSLHPDKTWLLAGYEEHVPELYPSTNEEVLPQWVRALVEAHAAPTASAWARRFLSYLRRSMKLAL